MKVLLVAPYRPFHSSRIETKVTDKEDIMPSAALLILAAVLREAGHTPIVREFATSTVDAMPDPLQYSYDTVLEIIKKEKLPLVGISFLFGGDFPYAWELARFIKEHAPEIKIITGGIHPTTFPYEILSNALEFDYVAIGEGEKQLVELADRMEASNLGNLRELAGFAFRDADGVVNVNETRDRVDYEDLPMPAWDLVDFSEYEMDLSNYFNPKGHDLKNIINIFSERGCPYKCTFCDLHLMQGRKLRRLSAGKFADELSYLVNERGMNYFRFQDDNLLVDNTHVINICREIVSRGLDIQFDITGGYVNACNDKAIDHLVAAGLVSINLNIEHGSEYMRTEVIKKPISRDKISAVVESLRRYKVNIGTNWIMGFPEDTNETLQETLDLINAIKPDRANVGVLAPYPGTPIFDQCVRDNLFIEKFDPKDYWKVPFKPHQQEPFIKPYKMTLEDLADWRKKFMDVRYKHYGHCYSEFMLPNGYIRAEDGTVRVAA
ncbi:B12-binding domain-containing radical SAM protein [Candidatus Thiosymbion oneisti]|uniref:B12-binding domain-containing radical SAM protein n=1 Tax=Candidatus Thiosymbion oneisti TaxID=589554 RepID=UPI00105E1C91|nr:radical SAM protein [Candidatus Thiosymbion oneisti]